jgi:hypothetical protein
MAVLDSLAACNTVLYNAAKKHDLRLSSEVVLYEKIEAGRTCA